MRAFASDVTVETASAGVHKIAGQLAEPLFRLHDPARRYSDGTIWAWGRSGRPAALLTLAKDGDPVGDHRWLHELVSLSPGPISAGRKGDWTWTPSRGGVVMQRFPKAHDPGEDEAKRLRQMRELARQFTSYELLGNGPKAQRYELRTLPQPIHRYADREAGLLDGAIFVIAYGLNPEIILLIEARREGRSPPEWTYGFGHFSLKPTASRAFNGWDLRRKDGNGP
jgi:hypothetical protein